MPATIARPVKPARLTEGQRRLAEDPEALKLVGRIARSLARRCPWRIDDFTSAGMLGLVNAARDWTAGPVPFLPFAGQRIRWAILNSFRDERPAGFKGAKFADVPQTLSLDHPMGDGDMTLADSLIDYRETGETPMSIANGHTNGHANGVRIGAEPFKPHGMKPRSGVHWDEALDKWRAWISTDGDLVHLGDFNDKRQAERSHQAGREASYARRQEKRRETAKAKTEAPQAIPNHDNIMVSSEPVPAPLPRGVRRTASGKFQAYVKEKRHETGLGTYADMDRAGEVARIARERLGLDDKPKPDPLAAFLAKHAEQPKEVAPAAPPPIVAGGTPSLASIVVESQAMGSIAEILGRLSPDAQCRIVAALSAAIG